VSMDFFTVSTLTGRVLFVLVLIAHDRRRMLHINCTEHPTSAWTAQQLVEALVYPEAAGTSSVRKRCTRSNAAIFCYFAAQSCQRRGPARHARGRTIGVGRPIPVLR